MTSLKEIIHSLVEMQVEGVEESEIHSLKLAKKQIDLLYGMFVNDTDNEVSVQELKKETKKPVVEDVNVEAIADQVIATMGE